MNVSYGYKNIKEDCVITQSNIWFEGQINIVFVDWLILTKKEIYCLDRSEDVVGLFIVKSKKRK